RGREAARAESPPSLPARAARPRRIARSDSGPQSQDISGVDEDLVDPDATAVRPGTTDLYLIDASHELIVRERYRRVRSQSKCRQRDLDPTISIVVSHGVGLPRVEAVGAGGIDVQDRAAPFGDDLAFYRETEFEEHTLLERALGDGGRIDLHARA